MAPSIAPVSPGQRALRAALLCGAGLPLAGAASAHLAWLALVAPSLGFLAARSGALPGVALLPVVWALPLYGAAQPSLPTPLLAACAVAGLFGLGLGLGSLSRRPAAASARPAAGLLLLSLALSLAPERAAVAREPWPPALASRLLDLAPTALVLECAGADWMRHERIYEPVGTDRFERRAWRAELAGPTLLLVGYAFAAATYLMTRRTRVRDVPA